MSKKIVTIIGARPQFIKAAVLSRLIRLEKWNRKFEEIIVHTGQHYDDNMSDVFFREMGIPYPDVSLNIGSGSHGKMTGEMLIRIEEVLLSEKPDIVLVYGDTNSTFAGAFAASKLHIPLAHVEAGLRSYWKKMPEEQNRVLTDHISDWLFCPTKVACTNLKKEGITDGVYLTGDIMLDASQYYQRALSANFEKGKDFLNKFGIKPLSEFFLLTIHRAENTDDTEILKNIIKAINQSTMPGIFPVHPRTRKMLDKLDVQFGPHIHLIDPVGYLDMIALEMSCNYIITDSGGVQKEAYFMKKPCITLRNQTEWVETVDNGWNNLVGTEYQNIVEAMANITIPNSYPSLYGDANCGEKILTILN